MARGKLKRSHEQLTAETDPRVRDPVIFNRIKQMVEHEACHPAWGCVLYRLHRMGDLTNEQKEAGDLFQSIYYDHKWIQDVDVDAIPEERREQWERRIDRYRDRWFRAIDALGISLNPVIRVVIDNENPCGEHEKRLIREGLQLVANFFGRGKNKK